MFSISAPPVRLCDGLPRRELLRVGGLSSLGLSLPHVMTAREAYAETTSSRPDSGSSSPASFGRAKSCIMLFLLGGPPQHETWDPKPDAPLEVRGDLKPIASQTPGLNVGELMPKTARMTDRICVLRAMSSRDNAHSSSGYAMLTGSPHIPLNMEGATPGAPNDRPCLGAIVQKFRESSSTLPGSIRLPEHIWNTNGAVWPGQTSGFLGSAVDPWLLMCDPNEANFGVPGATRPDDMPVDRSEGRRELLAELNARQTAAFDPSTRERWSKQTDRVFDLLAAKRGGEAFDLTRESDATRERYGRNRFGQSVLLARRLVEAGVGLVQVNWTRWKTDTAASPGWDNHTNNAERLKTVLMPPMDAAYSALLDDLAERGLLDETLVVWAGEFGRTPKINKAAGRDHWGSVFSAALAGGGVRGGQVIGSSDALGGQPKERRTTPGDLSATIFHALGIAPDAIIHDRVGRPSHISPGTVIDGVF